MVRRWWVNVPCRGVQLIWIRGGKRSIALAIGAGRACLDFFLVCLVSCLSPAQEDGPI